jgi:hypothetical protein
MVETNPRCIWGSLNRSVRPCAAGTEYIQRITLAVEHVCPLSHTIHVLERVSTGHIEQSRAGCAAMSVSVV